MVKNVEATQSLIISNSKRIRRVIELPKWRVFLKIVFLLSIAEETSFGKHNPELPLTGSSLFAWTVARLLLTGHKAIGKLFQRKWKRIKLDSPRFALPIYWTLRVPFLTVVYISRGLSTSDKWAAPSGEIRRKSLLLNPLFFVRVQNGEGVTYYFCAKACL